MQMIIDTLDPNTLTKHEQYVPFAIISQDEKYGIVSGNGHVLCPCICDEIKFGMPSWIALAKYKELEFLIDRHSNWGTFLFFEEEWGVTIDISVPFVLVIVSFNLFLSHNRRLVGCDIAEDEMKRIYDEFIGIIKRHNDIITREEVLSITDNAEVKEYLDTLSSLERELK